MRVQDALTVGVILILAGAACDDPPRTPAPPQTPTTPPSSEVFTASDGTRFSVEVVVSNVEIPWALAFAPDGRLFFTERPGRVRVVQSGQRRAGTGPGHRRCRRGRRRRGARPRAPSAVCVEPLRLPRLHGSAAERGAREPRRPLSRGRQHARRAAVMLDRVERGRHPRWCARPVRPRRQAVRDDGRRRDAVDGPGSRRRSTARCCASTMTAACPRTTRSRRSSTRSATATRRASTGIPCRAICGRSSTGRPATTR